MAQWQYQIKEPKLESTVGLDEQLQKVLREYGNGGWELVQVLTPKDSAKCQLIFKTEKPLDPAHG